MLGNTKSLFLSLLAFVAAWSFAHGFALRAPNTSRVRAHPSSSSLLELSGTTDTAHSGDDDAPAATALLKRERYVATNRFAVRAGKAARFEKRWADRKSRLAELRGFRYFHLMRRVTIDEGEGDEGGSTASYDEGSDGDSKKGNYVSLTIWEKKSNFDAWRTGSAFREAHGGTSVGAFVSTMISSARILRGAPRPAFYDGLLQQSAKPRDAFDVVDGWRSVDADGVKVLPEECFVACNQFFVPPENAGAFEQRWANRESKLKECEGFVSFSMLRRDAKTKGHGTVPTDENEPSYVSTTIWKDQASFQKWREGSAFKKAHGGGSNEGASGKKEEEGAKKPVSPPAPLWSKPPRPVFYQGTLVISNADGA